MGPRMIARLQKLSFGQVVRNDGPDFTVIINKPDDAVAD
jgi:hypothetical protein